VSADGCRRDVDERRFTGYCQRFGKTADFHDEIHGSGFTDGQCDAATFEYLESFELCRNPISPRNHLGGEVAAVACADGVAHDARVFVCNHDGDARQGAALCVGDFAAELRCPLLRQYGSDPAQQNSQRQPKYESSHLPLLR
jgi:hypothetical protein